MHNEKVGPFQVLLLALSIYVLGALFIETIFKLPADTVIILHAIDSAICILFLFDFFWRLQRASNKWVFLRWGWIDFVSSIPMLDFLRWGRLVRVVRVFRILRSVRSTKLLMQFFLENRANSAFSSAVFISLNLVVFSSIAILNVETADERNIRHAGDALWWAMSTITTVGYGDRFPISVEGRVIGVVLMIAGIGLFGTFTGMVASWFWKGIANTQEKTLADVCAEVQALRAEIQLLRGEVSTRSPSTDDLFSPGS